MSRLRWRWLAYGELVSALASSRGWRKARVASATVLVVIALHLLSSQIYDLVHLEFSRVAWWSLFIFSLSVAGTLRWLQMEMRSLLGASLRVNSYPRRGCKALIFFLSPPRKKLKCWMEPGVSQIDANSFVQMFQRTPWQQPLRAICAHLLINSKDELQYIYVVSSADHPDYEIEVDEVRKETLSGTFRYFEDFQQTVTVLASRCAANLEVYHAASLGTRWQAGIDFEDATELVEVLSAVFQDLRARGVRDSDILVDITGGSSLCSAIGAAVALEDTRRFQYVSQHSGQVRPYDLEYVISDETK